LGAKTMPKFIVPASIVFHSILLLIVGLIVGANYHLGIEAGFDRLILQFISFLYSVKNW
jgi:hypothetical protein